MVTNQPILLNSPTNRQQSPQQHSSGPVFDFGPGWGFYVKKWFGKYLFKIVLPAIVIIVAMGIFVSRNDAKNGPDSKNESRILDSAKRNRGKETIIPEETVKITVLRGDGRALLARKALAEYLKDNPQEILANGQKLFVEEILWRKLNNSKLIVGEVAEFATNDIKAAIAQAEQLTLFQLEAWEKYAKGIKF